MMSCGIVGCGENNKKRGFHIRGFSAGKCFGSWFFFCLSFASGQICHLGVVGSLQNGVSRHDGDDLRVTRSVC